jgi:hypothetical protein
VRLLNTDVVTYSFIGAYPHIESGLRQIGRRIFGDDDIKVFDARAMFPRNRSGGSADEAMLSERARNKLMAVYAADMNLYRKIANA